MQDTTERSTLETLKLVFFASVGAVLIGLSMYLGMKYPPESKSYDCSIAEISPDYPPAVKEGCRKIRMQPIDKNSK